MSLIKKITLSLSLFSLLLLPGAALAQYGLSETAGASGLTQRYPSDVPTLIGNVIGTALSMIAVIFFILMVYGGFLWMTAHGDSGQVDKAKDTIIAAIIGIIVVLASYAITNFVFKATNGSGGGAAGGGGGTQVYCLNENQLDAPDACAPYPKCAAGNTEFPDSDACKKRICQLSAGVAPGCSQ